MKINPLNVTFEPLAGSTFTNLMRLFAQNRFKIGLIGLPRALYSTVMSFIVCPLSVYEKIRFDKQVNGIVIDKSPIFIVGHWRSGTTYLHNLITQDTRFSYPTTFQTVAPAVFLRFEKFIKPIVEASLPPKRPEDDVDLGADFPQEEEYAMGNISPYSFYNGWCFPQKMEFYYKFVCMDNVSERAIDEWKKIYLYYLKKLTLYHKGKQLVLKNPSNTARIKLLLDQFPEAKFVHIYRNPYHTFLSMKRDTEAEMALYCMQKPKEERIIEKAMVDLYNKMFVKYFKEKNLIPKGNLVEVKYEDFIEKPLNEIERIYKTLEIPDFSSVKNRFKGYIASQSKIKTHKYKIDPQLKEKIYDYLKFTIDRWEYDV